MPGEPRGCPGLLNAQFSRELQPEQKESPRSDRTKSRRETPARLNCATALNINSPEFESENRGAAFPPYPQILKRI